MADPLEDIGVEADSAWGGDRGILGSAITDAEFSGCRGERQRRLRPDPVAAH